MLLGKLQGYNPINQQYTNQDGNVVLLPKPPFVVSVSSLPSDYDDYGTPENWDRYGKSELGSVVGFKDWMSLRVIIYSLITDICGVDYSGWDALNAEQKIIALTYFPTKIITAQGFTFFFTKS